MIMQSLVYYHIDRSSIMITMPTDCHFQKVVNFFAKFNNPLHLAN